MATDLTWFAVSLNFRLNSFLWKIPLQWDPTRNRFVFKPGGIRTFFWYYLVMWIVVGVISMGSVVYVIYGQMYHPKPYISLVTALQFGTLLPVCGFTLVMGIIVGMGHAEYNALFLNRILQLYDDIYQQTANIGWRQKKRGRSRIKNMFGIEMPSLVMEDGRLDKFGLTVFVALTPLPFAATLPSLVMATGIERRDVYKFVFEDMLPFSISVDSFPIILLRILLVYVLFAEVYRMMAFLIVVMVIPARLYAKIVESLMESGSVGSAAGTLPPQIRRFHQIQILNQEIEKNLATRIFLLMAIGLVISTCLNFCAIRFVNSSMALGIYIMFPFGAFVVLNLIVTLLAVGIRIHENSVETLFQWKKFTRESAQWKKTLEAMQPLKCYVGLNGHNFFDVKKSLMSTYMVIILENTIDLLLALPSVRVLQG
ncbi:hypothetical protein Fcan01_11759 [Folsomia candida]|uniref:Gustatory receptor n=1 Tax=Folsomia candida TaxID=158441 RepID=A0A226E8U5_FOLCA|nr:hypothetical protein Fcan01_11759 [Folsomia candida]